MATPFDNNMAVVLVLVLFVLGTCAQADQDIPPHAPVVQTKSGAVRGKVEALPHGKSVYEYLGIPFAEPPIGKLRFAAPVAVKRWLDVRDAVEYGAKCPQTPLGSFGALNFTSAPEPMREDCLFLNVFVPVTSDKSKLAVMVFIHGGAFTIGSSSEYPSGILAGFNDVIVVTVNYRLGILGFFNIPGSEMKGNYGMLDQVLALKWVQQNIGEFGGDPEKVTIFGESAGGISVSLHLISPLSQGLFQRAIIESGPPSLAWFANKVTGGQLKKFAELVNCPLGPAMAECVKAKSEAEILAVQPNISMEFLVGPQDITSPIVDGEFLTDLPEILFRDGKFSKDIDIIVGVNSDEGNLFTLIATANQDHDGISREVFEGFVKHGAMLIRDQNELVKEAVLHEYSDHSDPNNQTKIRQLMGDLFGDSGFLAPTVMQSNSLAEGGNSPYFYIFGHHIKHSVLPDWAGAMHIMELFFVFGAPYKPIPGIFSSIVSRFTELEKGLSSLMMKLWTNFAKTGNPNNNQPPEDHAVVDWPKYTAVNQSYLAIGVDPKVQQKPRPEKMAFWNEFLPKLVSATRVKDPQETLVKDEL